MTAQELLKEAKALQSTEINAKGIESQFNMAGGYGDYKPSTDQVVIFAGGRNVFRQAGKVIMCDLTDFIEFAAAANEIAQKLVKQAQENSK